MAAVIDQSFLMPILDVFEGVPGGGLVVTGHIERGIIRVGDEVEVVGSGATKRAAVAKMELSRKGLVDVGQTGDEIGILLREATRLDTERGQVIAKPGSIGSHRRLAATIHMRTKEEGGRQTPFRDGYRPYFYFWTCNPGGTVTLPPEQHEVKPGDGATVQIDLLLSVACEVGVHFTVRENREIVGEGVVTDLLD
jgi:elongation factor Tu